MVDPYAPPRTLDPPSQTAALAGRQDGIRRLEYMAATVILGLVMLSLMTLTGAEGTWVLIAIFILIGFVPAYFRLKNMATNPWACLLLIVPIVNLVILFRCLACQEGYGEVKRLDRAGRIVAIIFITLLFGILVLGFFAG